MTLRLRHTALSSALLAIALTGSAHAADPQTPWRDARQMVLVTTADWNADQGMLRTFAREGDDWHEVHAAVPVVIGKNGSAWGTGLSTAPVDGPHKHEGDNRSPAGVFRVGGAFGYAARADTTMPYRALVASDYCVDVSGAAQYNRIVDAKVVGAAAVEGSTEPMRRDLHFKGDQAYREGFVIENNPQGTPQAGSCIFAHLWHSSTTGTAGCTAMTPAFMQTLLAWLKPKDQPVFVLLPQAEYQRLRGAWHLPALAATDAAR